MLRGEVLSTSAKRSYLTKGGHNLLVYVSPYSPHSVSLASFAFLCKGEIWMAPFKTERCRAKTWSDSSCGFASANKGIHLCRPPDSRYHQHSDLLSMSGTFKLLACVKQAPEGPCSFPTQQNSAPRNSHAQQLIHTPIPRSASSNTSPICTTCFSAAKLSLMAFTLAEAGRRGQGGEAGRRRQGC